MKMTSEFNEPDAWSPPEEIVRWSATRPDGTPLGSVDIRFEGRAISGPSRYSIRAGYHNGIEATLTQRTFTVPRWQELNVLGLMLAGLAALGYNSLTLDEWPDDQYKREEGRGSAIPHEIASKEFRK